MTNLLCRVFAVPWETPPLAFTRTAFFFRSYSGFLSLFRFRFRFSFLLSAFGFRFGSALCFSVCFRFRSHLSMSADREREKAAGPRSPNTRAPGIATWPAAYYHQHRLGPKQKAKYSTQKCVVLPNGYMTVYGTVNLVHGYPVYTD